MIISFEGLPGSKKHDIYLALAQKYDIKIKSIDDSISLKLFQSTPDKYALAYQLDRLYRLKHPYEEEGDFYNSLHSFYEVYINLFHHKKYFDRYQLEVFQRYYDDIYQRPDVIVYLYGSLDKGYQRALNTGMSRVGGENGLIGFDEYKTLHYQYEWVFDVTNCKIPMYKVNVDDDLGVVLENIIHILKKVSTEPNLRESEAQNSSEKFK